MTIICRAVGIAPAACGAVAGSTAADRPVRLGGPTSLLSDDPREPDRERCRLGSDPGNRAREFFDATVENCRKIIDAVQPRRSVFTIEMMGWSVPHSPDAYVDLVKAADRKQFDVLLDVCNITNSPRILHERRSFISECFRKRGHWIVSRHAKDQTHRVGQQGEVAFA